MAWRISKSVVRGELDNRKRGIVTGRIWLAGRNEPLELDLEGNCLNDLAGTRVSFVNPAPDGSEGAVLYTEQKGHVGDITASRKVRELNPDGTVPAPGNTRWSNSLYVEWFSEKNGRVVIETTQFKIGVSERAWTPLPEEEAAQRADNQEMICSWLDELTERFDDEEPFEVPEDRPMNEFEWERFMRESDARAEKFSRLFEKYMNHPDRDRILAREMGWSWLEEALDTREDDEGDDFGDFVEEEGWDEELPDLIPNPLTEGTDWIRNEHGHIEHPLTERMHQLGIDLWRYVEQQGALNEESDADIRELVFKAQTTAAKLAGALNHLAYEDDPDSGFIVAALKRALNFLHDALAAGSRVQSKQLLDADRLRQYLRELFDIRQDILSLMQFYRQRIS